VQAVCGIQSSEWTPVVIGKTTSTEPIDSTGITDYGRYIKVYPNPAGDVINVQCTMNNVQSGGEIEIVDVYGKTVAIVETGRAPSLQARIDVSGLAAGMYFVRVMTEEGTVTKAFVKQ
jgi:hypothetical protein